MSAVSASDIPTLIWTKMKMVHIYLSQMYKTSKNFDTVKWSNLECNFYFCQVNLIITVIDI